MTLDLFRFRTIPETTHAITTRHGGVSTGPYSSLNLGYGTADAEENVARNRRLVLQEIGGTRAVAGRLTHGIDVTAFHHDGPAHFPATERPVRSSSQHSEWFFDSDGVVSDLPGLFALLTFGDCVPLLLFDPRTGAVGAAHAGWRGTAAGMASALVAAMTREFGSRPRDLLAGIGPSIGPCCYEVGPDVPATFAQHGMEATMRGDHLDLWDSNQHQFRNAGVESVEVAGLCTACHTDTFYSHRAEHGLTGRFALVAGVPE